MQSKNYSQNAGMSPLNRTVKNLLFVKDFFTEQIQPLIIKEDRRNYSQKTA